MNTLFIRFLDCDPDSPDDALVEWAAYDGAQQLADAPKPVSLRQAAQDIEEKELRIAKTVVFVPGESVLLTSINLEQRQAQHVKSALAFAMEDQVADDVENLHFALGAELGNEKTATGFSVAAVKKEFMRHWLHLLGECGLTPDDMLSEVLALPLWTLVIDRDKLLFKTSAHTGYCLGKASLPLLLDAVLAHEGQGQAVMYYGDAKALPALTGNIQSKPLPSRLFDMLCASYDVHGGINLLQGEFQQRGSRGPSFKKQLLIATLTGFLIYVLFNLGEVAYLQFETRSAQSQSAAITKALSSGSDAQSLAQSGEIITSLSEGKGFLPLMGVITEKINQLPNPADIALMKIDYDLRSGIEFEVKAPSEATLKALQQSLESPGAKAVIHSSAQESDGIRATIKVSK